MPYDRTKAVELRSLRKGQIFVSIDNQVFQKGIAYKDESPPNAIWVTRIAEDSPDIFGANALVCPKE